MKIILTLASIVMVLSASAQARTGVSGRSSNSSGSSVLTYDLGASAGSYGGKAYSEIDVGLNWYLQDWLNWRNAVFSRFGNAESATGLDSSARFEYNAQSESFGMTAFAGPGYRFSSADLSAAFVEAGLVFRVGGLSIGGGLKSMYYPNPGIDSNGNKLPNQDNSYFLIIGGGGVL